MAGALPRIRRIRSGSQRIGRGKRDRSADFRTIFARALGLNSVFPEPPAREQVGELFARDFAVYADALYGARRRTVPASATVELSLHFEVYASGEYARMLEEFWGL